MFMMQTALLGACKQIFIYIPHFASWHIFYTFSNPILSLLVPPAI